MRTRDVFFLSVRRPPISSLFPYSTLFPSPDYVGIENRQSFEELRDALGDHPVDVPMMQRYGFYPRYRLLVTYFIEKKGWTASQLLETRLTTDEAIQIMHADAR